MNREFMDNYVKLFKEVVIGKGADITFGNLSLKGKLDYYILNGRSIRTGKFYSALFPFSESEFFYLNENEENAQVLLGELEDTLVTSLYSNVRVFDDYNKFLKDKFNSEFINTFEKNLSIVQKKFIDDLVGFTVGSFTVVSVSITLIPTRCVTLTYSVEGMIQGKLALLVSRKNTIKNKYTGEYYNDFKELIESVGVPVEWERSNERNSTTTYVYEEI